MNFSFEFKWQKILTWVQSIIITPLSDAQKYILVCTYCRIIKFRI